MAIITAGGRWEHIVAKARVQQSAFPSSSYADATTAGAGNIIVLGFWLTFMVIILYLYNIFFLLVSFVFLSMVDLDDFSNDLKWYFFSELH